LLKAMARMMPTEYGQALLPPVVAPVVSYVPPVIPPMPMSLVLRAVASAPVAAPASPDAIGQLQQLADAGDYEAAEKLCGDLIRRDPTSARLHYYDAILRQVSDDPSGAEAALKRAIYLDRGFVLAHHRLGMLLLGLGRRVDARRSLMTAARLADATPSSEPLAEGQGVSASDLREALREQLAALGEAA
jgi:chemotaxis protein methyltransferase CheR